MTTRPIKTGILGGGQLGRMLLQAAANYQVETYVLEEGPKPPAATLCHHFISGDIRDFETVYRFGKLCDVLTIEIENVNVDALCKLEEEGLRVVPKPAVLCTVKDKGLQKRFYRQHGIPTADFILTTGRAEVAANAAFLPAAHKLRTGGYDGKGVRLIRDTDELEKAFDAPAVLEKLVEIEKEISVIVARNETGEVAVYPPTEMIFDPNYHLVDYLISPAELPGQKASETQRIAVKVVEAFNSPGIFAVEMFLDKSGNILVNETAPRAHNSGHQSIEGNFCSQYDMQMRVLQNLPLGDPSAILPSLMLNLIGAEGQEGPAIIEGLGFALSQKETYVHLYGKEFTRPGRKMGHITVLGKNRQELLQKAAAMKQNLKVVAGQ